MDNLDELFDGMPEPDAGLDFVIDESKRLIAAVALASGTTTPISHPVLPTGKSVVKADSPARLANWSLPSLLALPRSKPRITSPIFFRPESLVGCAITRPSCVIRKA